MPDWVFDGGRPKYGELPVSAKCVSVVHKMKEPPKSTLARTSAQANGRRESRA